ncbi:hypothetical protein [Streptomyces sp. NPDC058308]|uniref:hypothetical protein n=1 Tax=Streptomyces sp. NPDC058308 TaxID=3346440 RepID=UPI0036E800D8
MARTRSRTGHGQLLLLAALLLGIVTMHTLGHPSGGHGSGNDGGSTAVAGPAPASAPLRHHTGAAPIGPHDDGATTVSGTAAASAPMRHHTAAAPTAPHDAGATTVSGTATAPTPMRHHTAAAPTAPHDGGPAADLRPAGHDAATGTETAVSVPGPHGGMSMDPLSVCLAVLGAITLILLVRAGLLRPGGTLAHLPVPGRLRHAPRPEPPPLRILLARLSVLRV